MLSRQIPVSEYTESPDQLLRAGLLQDHEGGQRFVHGAKSIACPSTRTRMPHRGKASVEEIRTGGMLVDRARHRADHGQIIDLLCDIGEESAYRNSAFAISME